MIIKTIEIIFIAWLVISILAFITTLVAEKGNENAEVEGLFGKKK